MFDLTIETCNYAAHKIGNIRVLFDYGCVNYFELEIHKNFSI